MAWYIVRMFSQTEGANKCKNNKQYYNILTVGAMSTTVAAVAAAMSTTVAAATAATRILSTWKFGPPVAESSAESRRHFVDLLLPTSLCVCVVPEGLE